MLSGHVTTPPHKPPRKPIDWLITQLPALIAIELVHVVSMAEGYNSGASSLSALIFLTVILYTSLKYGLRQGLVSSALVTAYDIGALLTTIHSYSLDDLGFRRVFILAIALPVIAIIVGRLKEHNDRLLQNEILAKEQAEASETRWRFMAEAMPQKVFTNKADGALEYFNPQWMEYTGLTSKQIMNDNWINLLHKDDAKANAAQWQRSLATGEPFSFEHRLRRHDGQYRWHISRALAKRNQQGEIEMWVGSTTDIHDIKVAHQREQRLEKTTARLSEQRAELIVLNKAKDDFISLASHQLRTPATGVKQYIGVVLEGYAGEITPQQRAFLEQANESNERQITIINDLLKVAKVDAGKVNIIKQPTDAVELIRSIVQEQASLFAARQQTVIFKPVQKKLIADFDAGTIRMVLENIIDNAGKYTPPHKTIEIQLSKNYGNLEIMVKDQGVGIAADDIDKIFLKFSRLPNSLSVKVGGSGLGLYWAKKIIDLHGGSITVNSAADKGTIFTVRLPLAVT